jgi:hypothetical protein
VGVKFGCLLDPDYGSIPVGMADAMRVKCTNSQQISLLKIWKDSQGKEQIRNRVVRFEEWGSCGVVVEVRWCRCRWLCNGCYDQIEQTSVGLLFLQPQVLTFMAVDTYATFLSRAIHPRESALLTSQRAFLSDSIILNSMGVYAWVQGHVRSPRHLFT